MYVVFLVLILVLISSGQHASAESLLDDLLEPYKNFNGRATVNRHRRNVNNDTTLSMYETFPCHTSQTMTPVSQTMYFVSDVPKYQDSFYNSKIITYGHVTTINNPFLTFSVVEPGGAEGCANNTTETVRNTAKTKNCLVAQNGAYFNTTTGICYGNLVVNGEVFNSNEGLINAHFGILKNATIAIGYIPMSMIENNEFLHLIGGVGWLVRNGSSFVEEAVKIERGDIEETGTIEYFFNVPSARTAIGHNAEGQIIMVHVEGQTPSRGLNLYQFAYLLIHEFKLVNAINLDGGGSATLVLNDTVANYPSDHCEFNPEWRCERAVSSIVCVHEARCLEDCVNGVCTNGICACELNYNGEKCDQLHCARHNCSNHGICIPTGCVCDVGWEGDDCNIPCKVNYFGKNCSQLCQCQNNASCSRIDGSCDCLPGFSGALCESPCAFGYYGKNCEFECDCRENYQCGCNITTGICYNTTLTHPTTLSWNAALCYMKILTFNTSLPIYEIIPKEFQWVYVGTIGYIVLCASIVLNLVLLRKLFEQEHYDNHEGYSELNSSESVTKFNESNNNVSQNTEKPTSGKDKLNWKFEWLQKIKEYKTKKQLIEYTALRSADTDDSGNNNNNIQETALLS